MRKNVFGLSWPAMRMIIKGCATLCIIPGIVVAQGALAWDAELRVSEQHAMGWAPEVAVNDSGTIWVLWGDAGRYVNPDLTFAAAPDPASGTTETGLVGAHPMSVRNGEWILLEKLVQAGVMHPWPFPCYMEFTHYFLRRFTPLKSIRSQDLFGLTNIEDEMSGFMTIENMQSLQAFSLPDAAVFCNGLRHKNDAWSGFSQYLILSVDKSSMALDTIFLNSLRYPDTQSPWDKYRDYYPHEWTMSPIVGSRFALLLRQRITIDSSGRSALGFQRRVAVFDLAGATLRDWTTLDTVGLTEVDAAPQILLGWPDHVWICRRPWHSDTLMAEEWTLDGTRLRAFPLLHHLRSSVKSAEYHIRNLEHGGYALMWTEVLADSSSDVYIGLLDDSLAWITAPVMVNGVQAGNQYLPDFTEKNDVLYFVWLDERDSARHVYLRRGSLDRPTGITRTATAPRTACIRQIFPCPVRGSAMIRFDLPERVHVYLSLYDMLGRRVAVLEDGVLDAGRHVRIWSATVPSGSYYLRLQAGMMTDTRLITVVR